MESNRPVSPLSVMAQQRRWEEYQRRIHKTGQQTGEIVQQTTINRVVQESLEAVIRNLGDTLVQ